MKTATKKLHVQFSHALRGEELPRHIQYGGGSPAATSAAKLFKRELCDALQRPPSHPITNRPNWTKFNPCLGMDIAYVPVLCGTMHAHLLMLDQSADFTAICSLSSGVRGYVRGPWNSMLSIGTRRTPAAWKCGEEDQ
eukprot:4901567-Pyramimonas_sp.AAC.1